MKQLIHATTCLILAVLVCLVIAGNATGAEQGITIKTYTYDMETLLSEKEVGFGEITGALSVVGAPDGVELSFQGPTFEKDNLWDPDQTVNVDNLKNSVIGVPVKSLLQIANVPFEAVNVTFVAGDGYKKTLPVANFFETPEAQGEGILAFWYADEGELPEGIGYRLYFNAPDGIYGNTDMKETLPEAYWHYYFDSGSGIAYPSAKGISVMQIAELDIQMPEESADSDEGSFEAEAETGSDAEMVLVYEGSVAIPDENVSVTAASGESYEIPANTPLGVLQTLSETEGLTFDLGDKAFESKGILLLDGIDDYSYGDGENTWFVVVNDYQLQDFGLSETDGLNIYPLQSGDTLAYYFGLPVKPVDEAQAALIVTIE